MLGKVGDRIRPEEIGVERKAELLDGSRWARGLAWREVEGLARYFDVYRVPSGKILFREGDRERFMALVLAGRVRILKEDSARKHRELAVVNPGWTLGEMALIDGEPRSATAIVEEPTRLLVLTEERFERLATDQPRLWGVLLMKLGRLLSQRLRQTSGALVDHLPGED